MENSKAFEQAYSLLIDSNITENKNINLLSPSEIKEYSSTINEMVLEDETLPEYFLKFQPFATTPVKSDLGIFADTGIIVELHCEQGAYIEWAKDVGEFIEAHEEGRLLTLGEIFPSPNKKVVGLYE